MKEHGILMSATMIRAYLAGNKSQTRRARGLDKINANPDAWKLEGFEFQGDGTYRAFFIHHNGEVKKIKPPYGWKGDQLWFKETYAVICKVAIPYCECETEEEISQNHYVEYRADTGNQYPGDWPEDEAKGNDEAPKWKSSMFMPRKYARIVTSVVNVRMERLHSITREDVLAEGIERTEDGSWLGPLNGYPGYPYAYAFEAYFALWNQINGKKMPSDKNPWVWVYQFNPCIVLASPIFTFSKGHI